MTLKTKILSFLMVSFSKHIAVVLIATLPIFELRLSVPLGILSFKLPVAQVYFLSLLGNMIPVIPLLLLFKYFFHRLTGLRGIGKVFSWWFARVEKRSKIVERYGFFGLVLFVAIPLPVTGAWTGTVAATLFEMDTKKAFVAILIGVAIAGVVVSILSVAASEVVTRWFTFI